MLRTDKVRIRHILDASKEAVEFVKGRSRAELESDRKLNHSLVRLLEVIGEAARGMSDEFRTQYPELPWKKMVGMRDRLIHGYYDVDLDVVWETAIEDLPGLVAKLENILR
jgi:uncharacterized protein with HEPN domain